MDPDLGYGEGESVLQALKDLCRNQKMWAWLRVEVLLALQNLELEFYFGIQATFIFTCLLKTFQDHQSTFLCHPDLCCNQRVFPAVQESCHLPHRRGTLKAHSKFFGVGRKALQRSKSEGRYSALTERWLSTACIKIYKELQIATEIDRYLETHAC